MFVFLVGLMIFSPWGGGDKYRWTLIVFYSKSLSSGAAPTFLSPPNGRWCVVFALDLCVGGVLWFTELWHRLGSGTREADCCSLCVFQVSLRSSRHLCTYTNTGSGFEQHPKKPQKWGNTHILHSYIPSCCCYATELASCRHCCCLPGGSPEAQQDEGQYCRYWTFGLKAAQMGKIFVIFFCQFRPKCGCKKIK